MAESEGFEPPIPFQVCRLSRPEPSTPPPALRGSVFDCTSKQGLADRFCPGMDCLASCPRASNKGSRDGSPCCWLAFELLPAFQFIGQGARAVELAQPFDHARRVHRNRPILGAVIDKISGQRLDVA